VTNRARVLLVMMASSCAANFDIPTERGRIERLGTGHHTYWSKGGVWLRGCADARRAVTGVPGAEERLDDCRLYWAGLVGGLGVSLAGLIGTTEVGEQQDALRIGIVSGAIASFLGAGISLILQDRAMRDAFHIYNESP
jgi:hypothetical protein